MRSGVASEGNPLFEGVLRFDWRAQPGWKQQAEVARRSAMGAVRQQATRNWDQMEEDILSALPRRRERSRPAGEQRVKTILDATVQLVGAKGPQAVTHRAVAELAGVPLGSMTYYFYDLDDLFEQAMLHAIEVEAIRLLAISQTRPEKPSVDSSVRLLSQMFFDKTVADPLYDLALFELFMEATRKPKLRPLTQKWTAMIESLIDQALPETSPDVPRDEAVQLVATVIDGLMLEEASNQSLGFELLAARLRTFIERLL